MSYSDQGRCACGRIEFGFKDEPLNSFLCYCEECQKLTGSDRAFLVAVSAESFSVKKGTPKQYTRQGHSGLDVNYSFCGDCGLVLYGKAEAVGFVSIVTWRLDNAERYQPKMAIWTSSAPQWSQLQTDIPQFSHGPV